MEWVDKYIHTKPYTVFTYPCSFYKSPVEAKARVSNNLLQNKIDVINNPRPVPVKLC